MWTLYFVYLISALGDVFLFATAVFTFFAVVALIGISETEEKEKLAVYVGYLKTNGSIAVLFFILCALIPSDRILYSMFALDTMGKSDIPAKVLRILDKKLDALEKE